MKLKNIKKEFKKRIQKGMREYLSLKVKYSDLGVDCRDFLTFKKMCKLLKLEWWGDESGFVDHYYLIDPLVINDGFRLNVHLSFVWNYLPKNGDDIFSYYSHLPKDLLYVIDGNKFYYIEGMQGYKNPAYSYENNKDVPYWLYDGDEDLQAKRFYYTNDSDCNDELLVLKMFINNKNFSSKLFSGNSTYSLITGETNRNFDGGVFKDLSNLSGYCKTNYEEFFKDCVEITFAIRYEDYVDDFLSDLKKIIKKYKIKV